MHSLWNTQVIKCYALSMFAGCEDHVSDFVVRTAQVTVSVLRRFHCVLNHPRPWLTGVTCIRSTDFLHDWTDPTKFEFAISRSITCLSQHAAGSKHGALRPQKPLRPIRAGEVGGWEFISNTYSLHCHHQNDSVLRWAVVWATLMFSLIVWTKSQDSVHKPQFLKRRERRAEADRTKVFLLTSQAPYDRPYWLKSPCWVPAEYK